MYKEEIEEISLNNEIEVQRLKDQCNELKQELSVISFEVKETSKSPKKAEIVTLNENISIPSRVQSNYNSKEPSKNNSTGHSRKNSADSNDCSQSVKVVIRFRPPLKEEIWDKNLLSISSNKIKIKDPKLKTDPKIFEFDNIVQSDQGEEALFFQIKDCIDQVRLGKNACVLAYGQTGSGKTYTMNSVIQRAVDHLRHIRNAQVSVQCIEVYNEEIKNLNNTASNTKPIKDSLEVGDILLDRD